MDLSRRKLIALGTGIAVTGGIGYSTLSNNAPCGGSRESGPITTGRKDAPTVRVFSDYACPHCKSFVKEVGPSLVSAAEDGDIFYRHFDFPLPVDKRWSRAIPNVGRYVYEMAGSEAFFEFESSIYDHQGSYSEQVVTDTALNVLGSASKSDVRSVLEERPYCKEIDQEVATGEDHGVEGTPTVMVGSDWTYVEEPSFENIMAAIADT